MPVVEPAALLLILANAVVLGGAGALLLSRRPEVVVWIVLLAPCVPSAMTRNSAEGEESPGRLGGYVRVSLIMLAGGAGLVAWVRRAKGQRGQRGRLPAQYIVLAAFLAWAMVSTLRSAAPFYTFVRATTFTGLGCFMLGLHAWSGEERGLDRVLGALLAFIVAWTVLNAAAVFLWPGKVWWWNAPARLQGLKNHPNALGSFCAMACPVILWKWWRSRGGARVGLVALGGTVAVMLILSGSRTSLLCGGLGVAACLAAAGRRRTCAAFVAAAAAGALVLMASPTAGLRRRVDDGTAVNLTGRPAIWRAGWYLVEERPLEGFGYDAETRVFQDAAWQRDARVEFGVTARQSMHNGYLSVLAGTGVVGLALWLGVLAVPMVGALRARACGGKGLVVGMLSVGLVTNLVESQITPAASTAAAMFWVAWAAAGRTRAGVTGGPALPLRTRTVGTVQRAGPVGEVDREATRDR